MGKITAALFLARLRSEITLEGASVSYVGGDAGIMRDMVQLLMSTVRGESASLSDLAEYTITADPGPAAFVRKAFRAEAGGFQHRTPVPDDN